MKKGIKYLAVFFSVVFLLTILIPAQSLISQEQADKIQLISVTPLAGTILQRGTEVPFEVKVNYKLESQPSGFVSAGLNLLSGRGVQISQEVDVSQGSGTVVISGLVYVEDLYNWVETDTVYLELVLGYWYSDSKDEGGVLDLKCLTEYPYYIEGEAPPENQLPATDTGEDQSVIEGEAPPENQSAPTQYTLTINISGQGTINPVQGRSHIYSDGTQVTVTATPASGWSFDQWGGNASGTNTSVTITMDSNKNITAYFTTEMPVLEDIYPKHGTSGESVTLVGKNFGYEKRIGSYVRFGLSMAEIVKWTNDKIVVRAPDDYGLGIDDAKFAFKFITLGLSAASDTTFKFGLKLLKAFVPDLELITKKISEDEPLPLQWVKIAAAIGAPAGLVALRPTGELDVPVTVKTSIGESEERIIFTFNCDGLPPIDIEDSLMVSLASPGELRIYDSQGRVTGLVNGEVKTEVPNSDYYNEQLIVFNARDSYRYEVVGVDDDTYGLNVTRVSDRGIETFNATAVPTSANTIHQYTVDWDVLSRGEKGVTLKIDSDGDGTFEKTFTADSELTHDEFVSETAGLSFWIWIAGGVVITLILVIAYIFIKRRLARE